jgi:hypothetical protein
MEQYCWVVAGKRVERFADVTALVLKRHHVAIDEKVPTEELPAYVRRALNIMAARSRCTSSTTPSPSARTRPSPRASPPST